MHRLDKTMKILPEVVARLQALEQEYLDSDFRGLVVMQRSFYLFLIKWRNN
jgi:hypothetical protein